MEEKSVNKLKKPKIIIIVFLILTLLGGCYLILKDKNLLGTKDPITEKENKKEKVNTRELTKDEQEELVDMIEEVYNFRIASYYPIKDDVELTNQNILNFGFYNLGKFNFTGEELDNEINKYFFDKKYTHEDIICITCGNVILKYDDTTNSYSLDENHPGHGGDSDGGESKVFYLSSKITGEKEIEIKTKVLYSRYCGHICGPNNAYYKTFEEAISGENPILGDVDSEEDIDLDDNLYKSIEKNIPVTTYKFTKEDNKYSLKSVTIE